jgi:hypothetical protein
MCPEYSDAAAATSGTSISPSVDRVLISTDNEEAGLWLWKGDAPPLPSLPRPESRDQGILNRIKSAVGSAGWIALPAGLALMLTAVIMLPHPHRPGSVATSMVASSSAGSATPLSSAPSSTVAHAIVAMPPAEPATTQLDREPVPSAPAAKITAPRVEPRISTSRAHRKSSRSARKHYAFHARRGPLFPIPGVRTPPPMTWHGGGY